MTKEQLSELTAKYINNEISPQEEEELHKHWHEVMNEAGEDLVVVTEEPQTNESVRSRMLHNIHAMIDAEEKTAIKAEAPVKSMRTRKFYYQMAGIAAAAILIFAGIKIFSPSNQTTSGPDNTTAFNKGNDIVPGNNKATIILSDGKTINLDSIQTGSSFSLAGTGILKKEDGQLALSAGNDAQHALAYNTVLTPKGGQYSLVLPDGSRVWLNAESSLKVPVAFTGNERRVELSGEGYFEVAKNAAKPFKVMVSAVANKPAYEITVLGTHFNISAYPDESFTTTTLLEGKVAIAVQGSGQTATLTPGEQAALNNSSNQLKILGGIDTAAAVAWKNGYFKFKDLSIEEIMKQVSRWYDVDVEFDNVIPKHFVSTLPRNLTLLQTLETLEKTGSVHFKVDGKKVIVSK